MSVSAAKQTADSLQKPADPLQKLDAAVVASPPVRRYRAALFQTYVLGSSAVFIALAVVAHYVAYFPMDLRITRALQSYHGHAFSQLMYFISWIGFMPQVDVIGAVAVIALFVTGLKWEAVSALFAAAGILVGTLTKIVVYRPRPSADLVQVLGQLPSSGFPSGHVLCFTCFAGFFAFLCYTLLKKSMLRTALITFFIALIALMGASRIYEGQHWFSDVMGAYLLGSLWLALTIKFYRWGKPRFFVHQPLAPETPVAKAS